MATKKLALYISGETLPLQLVGAISKLFSTANYVAIDGKTYNIASADLSSDSLHSWKVSVELEVCDG